MSDTEYMPTLAQIRQRLVEWYEFKQDAPGGRVLRKYPDEIEAEFDRWLAAHDAELTKRVRAEQRETDARIVLNASLDARHERTLRLHLATAIREASDD